MKLKFLIICLLCLTPLSSSNAQMQGSKSIITKENIENPSSLPPYPPIGFISSDVAFNENNFANYVLNLNKSSDCKTKKIPFGWKAYTEFKNYKIIKGNNKTWAVMFFNEDDSKYISYFFRENQNGNFGNSFFKFGN